MIAAVVGPSGAGKDTLIEGALAAWPALRLARRVITRPTEAGGEDFDGVSPDAFERMRRDGLFALDWQAHGLCYAVPRDQLAGGGPVIFNGSRAALPQAVARLPGLRVILVTAPTALLARRLAARGRESEDDIAARLDRAGFAMPPDISHATVVNDGAPAEGIARLLAALRPTAQTAGQPACHPDRALR